MQKLAKPLYMGCANNGALEVKYIGEMKMINPYTNEYIKLTDVRYAKACPVNLLSERKLCDKIIFITLGNEKHLIEIKTGKTVHVAKSDGRFWIARMHPFNKNNSKIEKRKCNKIISKPKNTFQSNAINKIIADYRNNINQVNVVNQQAVDLIGQSLNSGGGISNVETGISNSGGVTPENREKILKINRLQRNKAKTKITKNRKTEIPMEKVLNQIKLNSEMNLKDILSITDQRVIKRLKETEGLLWHYPLNHASYSQMQLMKLDMPELKKVTLHDDIKNCLY